MKGRSLLEWSLCWKTSVWWRDLQRASGSREDRGEEDVWERKWRQTENTKNRRTVMMRSKKRDNPVDKESHVSYCRYCAAVRWEPGVFTGPHTRCLCRHTAEPVKIGTQCNTWLCVWVSVITCVCVAPVALHSTAICCWRNSSWQEVTCNAVAMAT